MAARKKPNANSQSKPGEPGPDYDYPRTLAELKERLSVKKQLRDEQAEEAITAKTLNSSE